MFHSFIFVFGGFSFLSAQDDRPLVKMGPITITASEFLKRYEMTPSLYRTSADVEANKAEFLLSMMAEKLLVLKAQQEGWDNDTLVQGAVREVERGLVRDELYRREVRQKVTPTVAEINDAVKKSLEDRKVYFLYAKTKEGIDFLRSQIKKGKTLESFRFDASTDEFAGPDSAMARWGEMDERMEDVVYRLKTNETSAPLKLDDGWYIVKLMGKSVTVALGEKERSAARERAEAMLRKRRETKRMTEFMNAELKEIRTEVNAPLMKSFLVHLWTVAQERVPLRNDTTRFFFDRGVELSIVSLMPDSVQRTLVTFPHTTWTLARVMEKITESALVIPGPTLPRLRADIERRLKDLIDQEYLVQSAYRRGLQQSASVRNDMKVWRESFIAQRMRGRATDSVSVTRDEIEELRRVMSHDTSIVRNDSVATARMLGIKKQNLLDRTVGTTANGTTITFYEKNLRDLTVTTTPALVYRFLGFGGRMFAVPLVIPQNGWLQYWNDKQPILP